MRNSLVFAIFALGGAPMLWAQAPRHELAFTLGQVRSQNRTLANAVTPPVPGFVGSNLDLGSGTALQADYGYRIAGGGVAALYIGGHLLASPQRKVTGPAGIVTRDFASLYLLPQATLKIAAGSRVSPWATFGGGYALYEHSTTTQDGSPNPAERHVGRSGWMWGGGVDVKIVRFLALRGEVRDFFTGNPTFNLAINGRQHNVVVGGGFVLRF